MIDYLNCAAAELKRNSVGDIAVTVIGIDAVKKRRSRARGNRQKAPLRKNATNRLVKRPVKSSKRKVR
jgi:hypothetical protein